MNVSPSNRPRRRASLRGSLGAVAGALLFLGGAGACSGDGDDDGTGGATTGAGTGGKAITIGGSSGSGNAGRGGTQTGSGGSGGSASGKGGTGGGTSGSGGSNTGKGGTGTGGAGGTGAMGGSSSGASGGTSSTGDAGAEQFGGAPGATEDGLSPYTVECDEVTPCGTDPKVSCLGIRLEEGGARFTCSNDCNTTEDCSGAPSGTDAEAACVEFTRAKHCVLVCYDNGDEFECPDGMGCYRYPEFPIGYCLWL